MNCSELLKYQSSNNATLLGIGPMSKNVVNAVIEFSNRKNIPIMLIASRRQIDSIANGGGYVNNWTSEKFSEYVANRDKKKLIFLSRDHGGPWQNNRDFNNKISFEKAMSNAKESFKTDILNNFRIIHIDGSLNPTKKNVKFEDAVDIILELYDYCLSMGKKNILYEFGTEEQISSNADPSILKDQLNYLYNMLNKNKLPKPHFYVVQTGTKVEEFSNVGSFEMPIRIKNQLPSTFLIPYINKLSKDFNFLIKQHNSDYLKKDTLEWLPKLGIHSANIAPEFGTLETEIIFSLLKKFQEKKLLDNFIQICVNSKKWAKWVSLHSKLDNQQKAILCGHYLFNTDEFKEIKKILQSKMLANSNLTLNTYIKNKIKIKLNTYANAFNLNPIKL